MTILGKINDTAQLTVSSSDLHQIEQTFNYRHKKQVQQFLMQNPKITKFLLDSREHLHKYFGIESKFFLEVVRDPEASGIVEELFVNIHTQMLPEAALNQLDELDRNWYFDNLDSLGGTLNFSLEVQ